MKRFEEKWTAWLDDQLSGRELSEFEASLPDKAAAQAEKAEAKKLGELLKRELSAHPLKNEEFFSHQLRERIVQESGEQRGEPARRSPTSSWWTIPRLLWAGTASLAGGHNLCSFPDDDRGARVASGGDSLERACHGGERYPAAAGSVGIDSDRRIAEKVFRLQRISGDWTIAKNP